jgi:hypothetical protein
VSDILEGVIFRCNRWFEEILSIWLIVINPKVPNSASIILNLVSENVGINSNIQSLHNLQAQSSS